ncbi:hypothetical protein A6M27_13615 [Acidithiobacillus thiooxidans]|uniref:Uncharacterized protein n=1 Tax=Acidithiobacillus thiooxidans TaxID=930 RepID=A0A1C2I752_ACITH|nr:hypothetical protein [Acidithiobacillus thiooxidans]OCX71231.1 hypothetical protein A6P07_12520 [Acidithiobacillus thiooxidans]OCX71798.1 hypothetical protein A6O24_15005 [Acidithiobacillus thiooxidans]OCX76470.1 hypothetical protein A6M23_00245 [Acidithiobacillus thiooxidans]OCX78566.1 hypothetical protein A6P08_19420 [Acidithiobacillus thiooxidans]OCX84522.1 hypothetical protein A6O26_04275 [Acidithiobacillus thiooxidans]
MINEQEKRRIGQVLLQRGFISPEQLERALRHQRRGSERLGKLLIAEGLVSEQDLALGLTRQARLRHDDRKLKSARMLAGSTEKLRMDLEKQSLDLLKEWQQRVPRIPDREAGGERKKRDAALRQAMDFPRALAVAREAIETAKRKGDPGRLRRLLSVLKQVEKDLEAFRQAIAGASFHPVHEWVARWQFLQECGKDIQRACV